MKTVYKYPLAVADDQMLMLRGRVLSVGVQNGMIMVWAVHDYDAAPREVRISVRGTGHPFDTTPHRFGELSESSFVGTVFEGVFVWHIFATELP